MIVQLKDIDGNVVEEKNIVLTDGDRLVVTYDSSVKNQQALSIYQHISKALESDGKVITIPNTIQLEVIQVEK